MKSSVLRSPPASGTLARSVAAQWALVPPGVGHEARLRTDARTKVSRCRAARASGSARAPCPDSASRRQRPQGALDSIPETDPRRRVALLQADAGTRPHGARRDHRFREAQAHDPPARGAVAGDDRPGRRSAARYRGASRGPASPRQREGQLASQSATSTAVFRPRRRLSPSHPNGLSTAQPVHYAAKTRQ